MDLKDRVMRMINYEIRDMDPPDASNVVSDIAEDLAIYAEALENQG